VVPAILTISPRWGWPRPAGPRPALAGPGRRAVPRPRPALRRRGACCPGRRTAALGLLVNRATTRPRRHTSRPPHLPSQPAARSFDACLCQSLSDIIF